MPVDQLPMSLDDVQRLYERPAIVRTLPADGGNAKGVVGGGNEVKKAHAQAVFDAGLKVGLKSGLAWQLTNVNAVVSEMSRDLDLVYNFGALMINQRVVPAVITEARNLYNQDGDYAVRLSGAMYKIERQARFTSVPPSWREYLSFPKAQSVDREEVMAVRDDEDRNIWRMAVRNGWGQGVEQANLMLVQAMDRLNRDFSGMARFHRFVVEGKVSLPAIAAEDIPVSQDGATMAVDETLLRLTALPQFNSKMGAWQGIVITDSKSRPAEASGEATKGRAK
jgi:defect in organelle trafficking protein DotC